MPPVEDHAVHEKTVQKEGFRYEACQGKKRRVEYVHYSPRTEFGFVRDTSSKACRYMDYEHDSGCTGCPQPKDLEYIEKMRGLG